MNLSMRPLAAMIAATAAMLAVQQWAAAQQQPCNPVIDGTFCAEQMPRGGRSSAPPMIRPIGSIGSAISSTNNMPAGTLGGISISSGGQTCIGLLRRGACN